MDVSASEIVEKLLVHLLVVQPLVKVGDRLLIHDDKDDDDDDDDDEYHIRYCQLKI